MKKTYASLLFAAILSTQLVACSNNADDGNANGASTPPASSPAASTQAPSPGANPSESPSAPAASSKKLTPAAILDEMLKQVEQPPLMDVGADMVQSMYHLDPALLEAYAIRTPLMNVKTNEIAILRVKNAADVKTVEDAVKQRAADVQKSFETYLPDQYENAKNYKLVTEGNTILFLISESADKLEQAYDAITSAK